MLNKLKARIKTWCQTHLSDTSSIVTVAGLGLGLGIHSTGTDSCDAH